MNDRPISLFIVLGQNPADMRPPEAVGPRRVRILDGIRMAMVLAVVSAPPQRPFLHGTASENTQQELKPPAGLIRAMGEIAMIAGRNPKHAHKVEAGAEYHALPSSRGEENPKTGQVHGKKRQAFYPCGRGPRPKSRHRTFFYTSVPLPACGQRHGQGHMHGLFSIELG